MDEISIAVAVVAITITIVYFILKSLSSSSNHSDKKEEAEAETSSSVSVTTKATKPPTTRKTAPTANSKSTFKHEWLNSTLKGPSGQLSDVVINSNDKFLLASSSDGSCTLWNLKSKESGIKSYKIPIEADVPKKVAFSPDSKAILVSLNMSNKIRIVKIGKKEDGSPGNFQAVADIGEAHDADICNIGIATGGQFVMVAYRDTAVYLYTPKGVLLRKLDTGHNVNYQATVSPCGRFVATCGFTPDVKVWEVSFSKSGEFRDVKRAYELKGHNAGVLGFAFSGDSSKIVSASKDGTWRLYDINIDHSRGEDPRFLASGSHPFKEQGLLVALSGDALTVALAQGDEVLLYHATKGHLMNHVQSMFPGGGNCVALFFDSSNANLFVAGDRQVVSLHNVVGWRARLDHWTEMRDKPAHVNNRAMRDRCDAEITEAKKLLSKFDTGTT